jgi:hypothetical protein
MLPRGENFIWNFAGVISPSLVWMAALIFSNSKEPNPGRLQNLFFIKNFMMYLPISIPAAFYEKRIVKIMTILL